MKKLMTLLATLSFATLAFAQADLALPSTLKGTMKAMSSDLKAIAAQATDVQSYPASAGLADQFVQLVTHAKDFTPDSIATLPASQQAAAKDQYDQMLDQTAALGTQLAAALRANDSGQVATILNQLVQAKKDGHNQFNP